MKRAIVSDIHANLKALEAVLADIRAQEEINTICCLGDVLGSGSQPMECLDVVMGFEFCLLGNADQAVLFDTEDRLEEPDDSILATRELLRLGSDTPDASRRWEFLNRLPRRMQIGSKMFVHGSARFPVHEYVFPEEIHDSAKMQSIFAHMPQACFQGHTHIPGVFTEGGCFTSASDLSEEFSINSEKVMINVGSVGFPRDGDSRACYAVLEDENRTVRFRRVPIPLL